MDRFREIPDGGAGTGREELNGAGVEFDEASDGSFCGALS